MNKCCSQLLIYSSQLDESLYGPKMLKRIHMQATGAGGCRQSYASPTHDHAWPCITSVLRMVMIGIKMVRSEQNDHGLITCDLQIIVNHCYCCEAIFLAKDLASLSRIKCRKWPNNYWTVAYLSIRLLNCLSIWLLNCRLSDHILYLNHQKMR